MTKKNKKVAKSYLFLSKKCSKTLVVSRFLDIKGDIVVVSQGGKYE